MSKLTSNIRNQVLKLCRYATRYYTRSLDVEEAIKVTGIRKYVAMENAAEDSTTDIIKPVESFLSYINQFPTRRASLDGALKIPGQKMLSRLEELVEQAKKDAANE